MRSFHSRLSRIERRLAGRARGRWCRTCGGMGKVHLVIDGEPLPGNAAAPQRGCPECGKEITIHIIDVDHEILPGDGGAA